MSLRFRPIMMTTMAALLRTSRWRFGTGVGSELRRPLGIAIVGGLVISQLLTLFTTRWCTWRCHASATETPERSLSKRFRVRLDQLGCDVFQMSATP